MKKNNKEEGFKITEEDKKCLRNVTPLFRYIRALSKRQINYLESFFFGWMVQIDFTKGKNRKYLKDLFFNVCKKDITSKELEEFLYILQSNLLYGDYKVGKRKNKNPTKFLKKDLDLPKKEKCFICEAESIFKLFPNLKKVEFVKKNTNELCVNHKHNFRNGRTQPKVFMSKNKLEVFNKKNG